MTDAPKSKSEMTAALMAEKLRAERAEALWDHETKRADTAEVEVKILKRLIAGINSRVIPGTTDSVDSVREMFRWLDALGPIWEAAKLMEERLWLCPPSTPPLHQPWPDRDCPGCRMKQALQEAKAVLL